MSASIMQRVLQTPKHLSDLLSLSDEDETKPLTADISGAGSSKNISILTMVCISAMQITYGVIYNGTRIIALPIEAERLYPENATAMMTLMAIIVGFAKFAGYWVGTYSDNNPTALGRRRPYLWMAALVLIIGLLAMHFTYHVQHGSGFVVAVAVTYTGMAVIENMAESLMNDRVPDHQIGIASGVDGTMNNIGTFLGFVMVMFFAEKDLGVLYFGSIVVAVVCIFPYFFVRERVYEPQQTVSLFDKVKRVFTDQSEKDYLKVLLSRVCYYFGGEAFFSFTMFYVRDQVGMANDEQREWWVSVSFLIRMGIGILAILPLGWYSDRNFSRRKMLVYIGCACLGVSILMKMFLGFIPHETTRLAFYLTSHVFVGFGQAFYQSVEFAMVMDCLPNQNETATALGLWNICFLVGNTLGTATVGFFLGFFKGSTIESTWAGYACSLACCFCAVGLSGYFASGIERVAPRKEHVVDDDRIPVDRQ